MLQAVDGTHIVEGRKQVRCRQRLAELVDERLCLRHRFFVAEMSRKWSFRPSVEMSCASEP